MMCLIDQSVFNRSHPHPEMSLPHLHIRCLAHLIRCTSLLEKMQFFKPYKAIVKSTIYNKFTLF